MEIEEGSNFLQRVITGDESWIYEYDPETKGRVKSGSSVVRLTAKKRARVIQKSRSCSLFCCCFLLLFFFFIFFRGVVHHEFVSWGQTVNTTFYVEVLKRLHERVQRV
jgi:hypothetical protein